ncbi:hypothetical protein [Deinococcus marmoris]|uniref:hypothetical protein n=1 Tax=Deinococcus marmoris TaxID=249408 RepID=UPI003CCBA663
MVSPHLPGLHHVQPGPHQMAYDLGFLLWGVLMRVMAPRCGAKGRRYDIEEQFRSHPRAADHLR